jgi:hypothetical protein
MARRLSGDKLAASMLAALARQAPASTPEHDLMFVFGGTYGGQHIGDPQRGWFFEGYGAARINAARLAYWRGIQALGDVAFLAEEAFTSADSAVVPVDQPGGLRSGQDVAEVSVGVADRLRSDGHVRRLELRRHRENAVTVPEPGLADLRRDGIAGSPDRRMPSTSRVCATFLEWVATGST